MHNAQCSYLYVGSIILRQRRLSDIQEFPREIGQQAPHEQPVERLDHGEIEPAEGVVELDQGGESDALRRPALGQGRQRDPEVEVRVVLGHHDLGVRAVDHSEEDGSVSRRILHVRIEFLLFRNQPGSQAQRLDQDIPEFQQGSPPRRQRGEQQIGRAHV